MRQEPITSSGADPGDGNDQVDHLQLKDEDGRSGGDQPLVLLALATGSTASNRFAQRLRGDLELYDLADEVLELVSDMVQPKTASVWIKDQLP